MEFYHNQLKIRLLNEKDICVYQRADWLVDKLGTKVHSYFWLDEYSEKDDFARYWKNEWMSGLTSWRKALKIPDTDVIMEDGCAKVTDQDKAFVVWNTGSMLSICNCSWAQDGNLCEHILKVLSICRKRGSILPSVTLFQYHQALNNMLHCPPFDSFIRDHAVSLAVSVQKQLNTLLDKESVQTVVDSYGKWIVIDIPLENFRVGSANRDQDTVSKKRVINGVLSEDSDGCEDRNDSSDALGCANAMTDIADQVVDRGIARNGKPLSAGEDSLPADMDVDPSSTCVNPPRLHRVDDIVSSDAFPENKERGLATTRYEISTSENGALSNDKIKETILDEGGRDCAVDVDPPTLDTLSSTSEDVKHCETETHQNGVNEVPRVISCTKDADSHLSPPSTVKPAKPLALDMGKNSGTMKEDVNSGSNT